MSTRKKRKIKIKKKNFTIFVIIILLIIILTYYGMNTLITTLQSPENKTTTKEENKSKNKNKNKNKNNIKLEKLGNIQNKIDYFNNDYLDRYLNYKKENKDLENEQIIKDVNMNLDLKHYEDTKEATHLNSEKILVNKYRYLTEDYVPENLEDISKVYALNNMKLVHTARVAFEELAKEAKKEDLSIVAMSTYRSYEYQVDLYNKYAKTDGKDAADTYSGRPGFSEHQTGYAVDVFNNKETYTNFEKTKEFTWMQEHAHEYGFILRFPKDKEKETGYQYESWHYRYVGKETAEYIHKNNISFEEYYATKIKDW